MGYEMIYKNSKWSDPNRLPTVHLAELCAACVAYLWHNPWRPPVGNSRATFSLLPQPISN